MCATVLAVDALQFRGHLREAYQLASQSRPVATARGDAFAVDRGDDFRDSARAEFKRVLALAPKVANDEALSLVGDRR